MRHTTILATIAITACLFAVGCGGGFKVGPSGWTPTDAGWRGNASVEFAPVDDIGVEGKASVIVERDGEQFTATVDTLIDERSVSILAGWGDKTTVTSCYDGPESLPQVCTIVTPAANGEDGEVCVTLGGVNLPCYALPAAAEPVDDGEQGAADIPDGGRVIDGGRSQDAGTIIDVGRLTPPAPSLDPPIQTTPGALSPGPVTVGDAG